MDEKKKKMIDLDLEDHRQCKELIEKYQFTLSQNISVGLEALTKITSLGFKIVGFDPIVLETELFPDEDTISNMVEVLRRNNQCEQNSEEKISKQEAFSEWKLPSDQGKLAHEKNAETKLNLPFPDLKNENRSENIRLTQYYNNEINSNTTRASLENGLFPVTHTKQFLAVESDIQEEVNSTKRQYETTENVNVYKSLNSNVSHMRVNTSDIDEDKNIANAATVNSLLYDEVSDELAQKQHEAATDAESTQGEKQFSSDSEYENVSNDEVSSYKNDNQSNNTTNIDISNISLGDEDDFEDDENGESDSAQQDKSIKNPVSAINKDKMEITSLITMNDSFSLIESNLEENSDIEEDITFFPLKKDDFDAANLYFQNTKYSIFFQNVEDSGKHFSLGIKSNSEDAKEFLVRIKDFKKVEINVNENIDKIENYINEHYANVKTTQRISSTLVIMGPKQDVQAARTKALSLIGNKDHETSWSAKSKEVKSFKEPKKNLKKTDQYVKDSSDQPSRNRDFYISGRKGSPEISGPDLRKNVKRSGTNTQDKQVKPYETHFEDAHINQTTRPVTNATARQNLKQGHMINSKPGDEVFVGNSGSKIYVYSANITELQVDCIVNTSNSHLKHEKGVSKVIAQAAGKSLAQECEEFVKEGNVVAVTDIFVSGGGNLKAKKIIHAVGPNWEHYEDDEKPKCIDDLRRVVLRCLIQASAMDMFSIALPSISSANLKVPKEVCAESYMNAVKSFDYIALELQMFSLKEIHFVDINKDMISNITSCFFAKREQKLNDQICREDLAFAKKHLERNKEEKKFGLFESFFTSTSFNRTRKTSTARHIRNKDYCIGEIRLTVSTRHAMDFNTDLVVIFGEPFDQLSGMPMFEIKKSKIDADIKNVDFLIYESKGKPSCYICQFGIKLGSDEKLAAALKKLNTGISYYPNLVQSLVVTSELLYPGNGEPYNKTATMFSQAIYEYALRAVEKGIVKRVIITTSEEVFPLIIPIIDSLQVNLRPEASGGSPVDDECGVCHKSLCKIKTHHCCQKNVCTDCITRLKKCPFCLRVLIFQRGNQPEGKMIITLRQDVIFPGYSTYGVYQIEYIFQSGFQKNNHPGLGQPYMGCHIFAYLPAAQEGFCVLQLLRVAFLRKLTFTIGTANGRDYIAFDGIPHITIQDLSTYINPNYLHTVTYELKKKGVCLEQLTDEEYSDLRRLNEYFGHFGRQTTV